MGIKIIGNDSIKCSNYKKQRIIIEWTAEKMYVADTEISLRLGSKHQFLAVHVIKSNAYGIEPVYRMEELPVGMAKWNEHKKEVFRGKLRYPCITGTKFTFELTIKCIQQLSGIDLDLYLWTLDCSSNPEEENLYENDGKVTVHINHDDAEYLYLVPRPALEKNGTLRLCIVPEDRYGNPAVFKKPIEVSLNWGNQTKKVSVQNPTVTYLDCSNLNKSETLRVKSTICMEELDLDENILNGKMNSDGKIEILSSPVWLEKEDRFPAFGEFHWHTKESGDGGRTLVQAVEAGRDTQNMDFLSSANHYPEGEVGKETFDVMDSYNKEGEFVTFYGWEAASDRGHGNFYFTDRNSRFRPGGEANLIDEKMKLRAGGDVNLNKRPNDYMDELAGADFLFIPHHTNVDGGKYWTPFPWESGKGIIRLVEIMQVRGNQEFDEGSNKWRSYFDSNGSSIRQALELGYVFGFTGGTDNHTGWPARVHNSSDTSVGVRGFILTGAWICERSRKEVFNALYNRFTWAVWGTRALVDFRINGQRSGSQISICKGEQLEVELKVSGEDSLWRMEILSRGGKVVWSGRTHSMDYQNKFKLPMTEEKDYFYFRAMEKNGAIIYASPVFVEIAMD